MTSSKLIISLLLILAGTYLVMETGSAHYITLFSIIWFGYLIYNAMLNLEKKVEILD